MGHAYCHLRLHAFLRPRRLRSRMVRAPLRRPSLPNNPLPLLVVHRLPHRPILRNCRLRREISLRQEEPL
jgi:hypothetical protein